VTEIFFSVALLVPISNSPFYTFRHVILPKELLRQIHRGKLLTEAEWRSIGVQQSRGWQHYAIHKPEPHILLFRRPLGTDPATGRVDPTLKAEALEEYKNQIGFKRCAQK
jgi:cyclin-dependent kinase regulatory subunit CKS1